MLGLSNDYRRRFSGVACFFHLFSFAWFALVARLVARRSSAVPGDWRWPLAPGLPRTTRQDYPAGGRPRTTRDYYPGPRPGPETRTTTQARPGLLNPGLPGRELWPAKPQTIRQKKSPGINRGFELRRAER